MKKIMFNDKYGLTQAVLEGRKTQTRRIVEKEFFTLQWDVRDNTLVVENEFGEFVDIRNTKFCMFKVGEIVAIAQSYKEIGFEPNQKLYRSVPYIDGYKQETALSQKGWNNKMFVASNLMPHHIRITNVRIERLQDISDEDCLKEGVQKMLTGCEYYQYSFYDNDKGLWNNYKTPREAFAHLINKVSRKDVWKENPYVFVYDFELIK